MAKEVYLTASVGLKDNMVLSRDSVPGAVLRSRYAWRRSTKERIQDFRGASELPASVTVKLVLFCSSGRSAVSNFLLAVELSSVLLPGKYSAFTFGSDPKHARAVAMTISPKAVIVFIVR